MRLRGTASLVITLLCSGCYFLESPTPWELSLRSHVAGEQGKWVVLGDSKGQVELVIVEQQGSPTWGVPQRVRLRWISREGRETVREIPGKYWVVLREDTTIRLLVEHEGKRWWFVAGKGEWRSAQWQVNIVPEKGGLFSVGSLGRGRWVVRGDGELWLYDDMAGTWERLGRDVVTTVGERGRVAWVQRDGPRFSVQWLDSDGKLHWVGSGRGQSPRLWFLSEKRLALALQRNGQTWIRLWYGDSVEQEWSCPVPVEHVTLVESSEGVSLFWLVRQGGKWELWERRGQKEQRVLSIPSEEVEACLQSVRGWWLVAIGEQLFLGERGRLRGHGHGEKLKNLESVLWVEPSVLVLWGREGVQLWELSPTSADKYLQYWGAQVLIGLLGLGSVVVGGQAIWRYVQRRTMRALFRSGQSSVALLELQKKGAVEVVAGEVPRELLRQIQEESERQGRGAQTLRGLSARLFRSNERKEWWMWIPLPLRLCLVVEVTEQVREQELNLATTILHELRGQLNQLRDLLQRGELEGAQDAVDHLVELAESARQLARSEPRMRRTALRELWEWLHREYAGLEEEGILRLHEPPPWEVQADRERLFHALRNGIANAEEALRDPETRQWRSGARIEVRARLIREEGMALLRGHQKNGSRRRWVLIEIQDTGRGLSGEIREGLGIKIIRQIAREHGGYAEWKSSLRGDGTCLRLFLPVPTTSSEQWERQW